MLVWCLRGILKRAIYFSDFTLRLYSSVESLNGRVAQWHDCRIVGFPISSVANVQLRKMSFNTFAQLCSARATHVDYWAEVEKNVRAAEFVRPNYNRFTCTQSMRNGEVPVQNGYDDDTKMCGFRKKITIQTNSEIFLFCFCGNSLSFTSWIARITNDFVGRVWKKFSGMGTIADANSISGLMKPGVAWIYFPIRSPKSISIQAILCPNGCKSSSIVKKCALCKSEWLFSSYFCKFLFNLSK